MRSQLFISAAIIALAIPSAAFAQSTGSVDFDNAEIVVTARKDKAIIGIRQPETSKAKGVLTQEFISRQTPGNSILNTINSLPGVNFQNNDPFGSAGGTLNIRGFDSSRINLTFDGIPLNDSGNYAIFSNQQLDPELIEQVNVNYGSTDVDSPSAAASGSTVNYRTANPTDEAGGRFIASVGDFNHYRFFAQVNTGAITSFGTKLYLAASRTENDWFLNDFGKIDKQQYNGKIYQPIGNNGDFISLAGNYNQNRNNFGGSAPLRADRNVFSQTTGAPFSIANPGLVTGAIRNAGTGGTNRFPDSVFELPFSIARCTVVQGVTGVAQTPNGCGTSFDERFNPSNTGNVRINSKFSLTNSLVLTVDPSFQFVKANGGGTQAVFEGTGSLVAGRPVGSVTTGYVGSILAGAVAVGGATRFAGRDLNGDGDILDSVQLSNPSQTNTSRYGVNASLRWDIAQGQTVRVSYAFDSARHRQTAEVGFLRANGAPFDVFAVNNPITAVNGTTLQTRDRLSFAILNQVSGEYRGKFFGNKLEVTLGLRAPFFERELSQNCLTANGSGTVVCTGATQQALLAAAFPYTVVPATGTTPLTVTGWQVPQRRTFRYNDILPTLGFVARASDNWSFFGNYTKGLSAPNTDSLYQSLYFPAGSDAGTQVPETTDNFDLGVRYASPTLQFQVGPWLSKFTNRLASAFDPDTNVSIFRNLGKVDKYGVDGSVTWAPIPELALNVFGSYLWSEIKTNLQVGSCPTVLTAANTTNNCTVAGAPIFALTQGRRESGASVYSFGARLQGKVGPLEMGIQTKTTGERFLNDQNLPVFQCTSALVNQICPTAGNTPAGFTGTRGLLVQTYAASTPAYTLVDFDARLPMDWAGLNDTTYLQFNIQNITNESFVGGFNGGATSNFVTPFAQIGTPRTFVITLNVGF